MVKFLQNFDLQGIASEEIDVMKGIWLQNPKFRCNSKVSDPKENGVSKRKLKFNFKETYLAHLTILQKGGKQEYG